MQNEILINATPGETRVALLEKKQFVELLLERAKSRSVEGAVVKGRVARVLPGMQAAFVDVGLEKAAFLYAGDYVENIEQLDAEETGGPSRRGRFVPNIATLLDEGQEIVVQIAKEPIGSKGARATSQVSIAGRHLVLTPWSKRVGVSKRIGDDKERRRLRDIVGRLKPADLGFIVRTASGSMREAELAADIKYLTRVWDDIQIRKDHVRAPARLYEEPALALRVIRDFANSDTQRIVVDDARVYEELKKFLDEFVADPKPRLEHYRAALPIFDHFGAETTIDANLGRRARLPSGGYLIIDQSEALTSIDVNTGRYVGKRNIEDTVLKTNLEAVQEVVNQLRFRNIGGLIIIDLIDMENSENRAKVNRALLEAVKQDKARTNVMKISELGLVEMTRKRTRENLMQLLCEPCAYCDSKGYVLSDETMTHKVLREIRKDLPRFAGRRVAVSVARRVAEKLLGAEHATLRALESELGRAIEVRARADMHLEQFEIFALESGDAQPLKISWLKSAADAGDAEEKAAREAPQTEPAKPATRDAAQAGEPKSADVAPPAEASAAEPGETRAARPQAANAAQFAKSDDGQQPAGPAAAQHTGTQAANAAQLAKSDDGQQPASPAAAQRTGAQAANAAQFAKSDDGQQPAGPAAAQRTGAQAANAAQFAKSDDGQQPAGPAAAQHTGTQAMPPESATAAEPAEVEPARLGKANSTPAESADAAASAGAANTAADARSAAPEDAEAERARAPEASRPDGAGGATG